MSARNVYAICHGNLEPAEFFKTNFFSDIDLLKKRKQKTELEIATDEKNKETVSNQIRLLTEKLEEIELRQEKKRVALAKIDDVLTQSEIGTEEKLQTIEAAF